MQVRSILLVLVILQVALITFGGFLYSLIEIEQPIEKVLPNCSSTPPSETLFESSESTSSTSTSTSTNSASYLTEDDNPDITNKTFVRPSFSDSVFFVVTTVTTIGYGKFSPTSGIGKLFTIIVAFIGVPVNIVILAKIGELFKNLFISVLKPLSKYFKRKKIFMILQLLIAITIGSICFVLVPGILIANLEKWYYIDAIYYVFITLFTIGFGDFVAGSDIEINHYLLMFYRFLLYMWMYLGMAYISLIINLCLEFFEQKAENISKEIRSIIEEKIHLTIKRHLMSKRNSSKRKKEDIEVIASNDIIIDEVKSNTVKLKINYDEEKLAELAQKRRASRVQQHQQSTQSSPQRYTYTNDVYFQDPNNNIVDNHGVELKEFENNLYSIGSIKEEDEEHYEDEASLEYSSCSSSSGSDQQTKSRVDLLQADDACLKIDIELLTERTNLNKQSSSTDAPRTSSSSSLSTNKPNSTSRSLRPSLESLSSAFNIKNLFQGTTANSTGNNTYDNDLYGLVQESGSEESVHIKPTTASTRRLSKANYAAVAASKQRRMTEFEIYVPVVVNKLENSNLFTKI